MKIEENEAFKNLHVEEFLIVTNADFDYNGVGSNGIELMNKTGEHSILEEEHFSKRKKLELSEKVNKSTFLKLILLFQLFCIILHIFNFKLNSQTLCPNHQTLYRVHGLFLFIITFVSNIWLFFVTQRGNVPIISVHILYGNFLPTTRPNFTDQLQCTEAVLDL